MVGAKIGINEELAKFKELGSSTELQRLDKVCVKSSSISAIYAPAFPVPQL